MDRNIPQILNLLKKLVALHARLLEVVQLERDVLIRAEVAEITKITEKKQQIAGEIQAVETLRTKATRELALELKLPESEMTLSKVIDLASPESKSLADELKSVFGVLQESVKRVLKQNEFNQELLYKSLFHINRMRSNLSLSLAESQSTYSAHGQKVNPAKGSHLLSKEG